MRTYMNLDNGGELSVEDITEDRACICFVNPGTTIKTFILPKKYLDSLATLCYSHLQDGDTNKLTEEIKNV